MTPITVILLAGGDKSTQPKGIKTALELARQLYKWGQYKWGQSKISSGTVLPWVGEMRR